MKIRKMTRADLPKLARMTSSIFKEPCPNHVLLWLSESFKKRIDGACLVAEDKGKPVGAIFGEIMLTTQPGTARVREFFVARGYRGKGIGKELMARCLEAMKNKGMKSASLLVREKNARALKLYQKAGFKKFRLMLLRRF